MQTVKGRVRRLAVLILGAPLLLTPPAGAAVKPTPNFDHEVPQVAFAAAEIQRAADAAEGASARLAVELAIDPTNLKPQCYRIERAAEGNIRVTGGDANGAMYGGLDVAEAIRLGTLGDLQGRRPRPLHRSARHQVQHPARRPHS